jgi:hypothetical protein
MIDAMGRSWSALIASVVATSVLAAGLAVGASGRDRTGVRVKVTVASCPVEGAPECDDKPFDARLRIRERERSPVVASAHSGDDGKVFIRLEPGHYVLSPEQLDDEMGAPERPVPFRVRSGKVTRVQVEYDTGIR